MPSSRSSRPRAISSPIATASRSVSSSSIWVESAYGESRADQRISFAQARPIPATSRWSRSSECNRRESDARIRATSSTDNVSASGPRCASSSCTASGRSSHTPARFFEPASVSCSSPPSTNRRRNIGVFAPFPPFGT